MLALSRGLPRRVLPLVQFATTATLQSNESCKSVHAAFSNLHTYSRLLPEPARARQLHLQQHSWCRQISSSMVSKLPPLSSIETATLKRKDGTEIQAKTLWETTPVFIYCIRRPGCVLCRDEAQKLWAERAALEAAGLKVVCVVHEWIDREIEAFVPEYWSGEIYHDVDKAFYKVFGDGAVRKGSNWSLLNPLSAPAVWSRIMAARRNVKDSNLNGEASILGGLLVVKAGQGGIGYCHPETCFGEFPDTQDVIAAAKKAVGKA